MQDNERYFIQSKIESNKFLRKIYFHQTNSYTHINSYSPNISDYPLSFTSLKSIQDYIFNNLLSESPYEISYNFMQEAENLKIVKISDYQGSTNMNYLPECADTFKNNIVDFFRKAAFKYTSYKLFNSKITDHYIEKTKLDDRKIGYRAFATNDYIVNIREHQMHDSYNDFLKAQHKLTELGLNCYYDFNYGLITFNNINDLNFARISIEDSKNWQMTREEEINSIENNFSSSHYLYLG